MKKNMLKKTLAALSAVSIAAISMAAFTVNAAAGMTFDIDDVEAQPGETVVLNVNLIDNTEGLAGFKGAIELDESLTFVKAKNGELLDSVTGAQNGQVIGLAGAATSDVTGDNVLFTVTVTVPADAQPGTVYNVNWTTAADDPLAQSSTDSNIAVTYLAGSITIPEAETTAAETTTAATTTTTAAATTAATTTTAAATTVVTPPKTGSTGIAATAAVLVAAAGAAVVVSKKRK